MVPRGRPRLYGLTAHSSRAERADRTATPPRIWLDGRRRHALYVQPPACVVKSLRCRSDRSYNEENASFNGVMRQRSVRELEVQRDRTKRYASCYSPDAPQQQWRSSATRIRVQCRVVGRVIDAVAGSEQTCDKPWMKKLGRSQVTEPVSLQIAAGSRVCP